MLLIGNTRAPLVTQYGNPQVTKAFRSPSVLSAHWHTLGVLSDNQ